MYDMHVKSARKILRRKFLDMAVPNKKKKWHIPGKCREVGYLASEQPNLSLECRTK